MDDNNWEEQLWTPATRAAYLEAGEAAIEAFRSHLEVVASATSEDDEDSIDDSAEIVRQAFIVVSDAQFDYSSTVAPFSLLELDGDEDEDDDDEDDDHEGEAPLDVEAEHNQISILLRRDYRLTSQAKLIQAGRTAYGEAYPDDSPQAATDDVQDLGRALYQVIHARGVDALNDLDGLDPVGGVLLAAGRDDLLTEEDLDEMLDDPAELFAGDVEVIYSQSESWS